MEEVIQHVQGFNWGSAMGGQVHVGDAKGDAVVIGPGVDGELSFTRKPAGDGFLISTNFNLAEDGERENRCERYDIAAEMLKKAGIEQALSPGYIKEILDATHAEGAWVNTLYSTVYDLSSGVIYVYYFHQFSEVVELNVAEEVSVYKDPVLLSSLFSSSTVEKASSEKSKYLFQDILGMVLIILGIIVALVILFLLIRFWRKWRRRHQVYS